MRSLAELADRDCRWRARLASAGLCEGEWAVLLAAAAYGPTRTKFVGAGLPGTTALRYIGLLESRGLVARQTDGQDGRVTLVKATEGGYALVRSLAPVFEKAA